MGEKDLEVNQNSNLNKKLSRRRFLQVIGASSAAATLSACANDAAQKIYPFAKGDKEQIPGVAVWYASTCVECSAGCGIHVRTREGRAVKVEGNPDHPVNKGGLCARGQASLQALYDPDRVREPMARSQGVDGKPIFKPISWSEAYGKIAQEVKNSGNKRYLLTSLLSGSLSELADDFSREIGLRHVSYELFSNSDIAQAAQIIFGKRLVPTYNFETAELVVNFGADFLETWISPCEFARGWSDGRRSAKPLKLIHIEPRLSLTGANADLWLKNSPASELNLALALLKIISTSPRVRGLTPQLADLIRRVVDNVDPKRLVAAADLRYADFEKIVDKLFSAKSSLVIAGGTACATSRSLEMQVVVNLINLVLGNVGQTISFARPRTSHPVNSEISSMIADLQADKVDLVFMYGTNPAFSLPSSSGFAYALKRARMVVSFSSHLDETTALADLILPAHHSLESWGDLESIDGEYSLIQPTMLPVFQTKQLGDIWLELMGVCDKPKKIGDKPATFLDLLKERWRVIHSTLRSGSDNRVEADFDLFWRKALQKGGFFNHQKNSEPINLPLALDQNSFGKLNFKELSFDQNKRGSNPLVLYPYPSVKTFDGRFANRPWLQELADPVTQIVWGSWAEVHPKTAAERGLAQGDVARLRNYYGEVNLPIYVTENVHPGIVAVPIGNGHSEYGRFARKIKGGNVLDLVSVSDISAERSVSLLNTKVDLARGVGKAELINVQGSDSQLGRDLAKSSLVTASVTDLHDHSHNSKNGHHLSHDDHHQPKQMYEQRKHPVYSWGMVVDLASCTGCSACVVACYAENNIPVVGPERCAEGREMSWLRIERYYEGAGEELEVRFLPMMCQHCGNAPCEPVCPVYATYHNEEGLNAMIYNRCVGTRYCSNNCSYKVRRFNWFEIELPEPLNMQYNPDVTRRSAGVMEKCTFCVQRIIEAKDNAKDEGRLVRDGEIKPACAQSCPTQAITFGNLNDPESKVAKLAKDKRAYKVLDHHLNTQPAITYLEGIRFKV
ncbi:MAG TPA: molybdopterin-dependent oxidoreductase [Oligoflexia bacterium]|nr:molybdopterin-dependent oxidoreductase [Oligoflexia bacterium]HMP26694.1 molybdopterin-dependent oxidoreductase [Oligoflexia bacterium]